MRLRMLGILIASTVGTQAWAEPPAPEAKPTAPSAAAWDDSHMQSRYQDAPRPKRPLITGETGLTALANGTAKSSEQVPESIEYTSQRQWTQGPLTGTSRPTDSSSSAPQPGSVHRGGQSGAHGSALRSGSVHSGSRGR